MKIRFVIGSVLTALLLFAGAPAWAQSDARAEVGFTVGWTFSDGVTGDGVRGLDGNVYNAIDPKDAFSWGFSAEYYVNPNVEVGFLYNRQQSTLEVSGTATQEVGDFNIDNYLGIFTYNFGDGDVLARPFVLGGIGATNYGGVSFTGFDGSAREIPGQTKFAASIGGGMKVYPAENFGLRLQVRWTPTYIKSDAEGYWCDPYWGCYVVSDAQYSNQFEMAGGVTLRF